MKKTLYSLMLADDVVREIDALAHRMGTNRSSLINQLLADYVSITTPERRINEIFTAVEELLAPTPELVTFFAPNTPTMSLKSSLEYKYRPTVRYEVELYRGSREGLGELTVAFRTQSAPLVEAMTEFFRLWTRIEDAYLSPKLRRPVEHALYDGKFIRSIGAPSGHDLTAADVAAALSDYIKLFDRLMKAFVSGGASGGYVERAYLDELAGRAVLI